MKTKLTGLATMGGRLRAAREAMELRQSDLAAMIGVRSPSVISNWELGVTKPDLEKFTLLCQALRVPPAFLLGYYGAEPVILPWSRPAEQRIATLVRRLDERQQAFLVSWLETALDEGK